MKINNFKVEEIFSEFVPKKIYEDLRNKLDEILIKIGRMQERMLFLLEYRLGIEKEEGEESGGSNHEILDYIRKISEEETHGEARTPQSETLETLVTDLRKKSQEVSRLKEQLRELKEEEFE